MTKDMDAETLAALKELLAKVEAGTFPADLDSDEAQEAFGRALSGQCLRAYHAYLGSLDATKALHEAVLPEWHWVIGDDGEAEITEKSPTIPRYSSCYVEKGENPARAWLIAILKALIWEAEQ